MGKANIKLRDILDLIDYNRDSTLEKIQICRRGVGWDDVDEVLTSSALLIPLYDADVICMGAICEDTIRVEIDWNVKSGKWTPCSERMPDMPLGKDEVLVTIVDEEGQRDVYKGFYEDGEWFTQWFHGCHRVCEEMGNPGMVTAWMPLPKPYERSE